MNFKDRIKQCTNKADCFNLEKELKIYSTFNLKSIAFSLCKILEYVYEREFHLVENVPIDFGSRNYKRISYVNLLESRRLLDENQKERISKFTHAWLNYERKLGDLFELGRCKSKTQTVTFYYTCDVIHIGPFIRMHSSIDGHLKEFVDEVIQYRIDNKIENISDEQLNTLTNDFIIRVLEEKKEKIEKQINNAKLKLGRNCL